MKQLIPMIIGSAIILGLFALVPDQRVHVEVEPQEVCRVTNIPTGEVSDCYQPTDTINENTK